MELLLQAERDLTVGQVDAAERLFRQVLDGDPRNSIAAVGLARVSLERGDDKGAYLGALRALEIDAENAAAQRMVGRLDEVMRHRGETPPTLGGTAAAIGAPTPAPAAATPAPPATPATPPTLATRPTAPPASTPRPKKRGLLGRLLGRR
jgi:thioredoxin-like negative regulator of GroEL